jgi:hypothetical protein
MARSLSALFLRCALDPLLRAARCFDARNVDGALDELTREQLLAGLRRGVETVAKAAGHAPFELFKRMPMPMLDLLAGRLASSQAEAVARWRAYPGRAGGLLDTLAPPGKKGGRNPPEQVVRWLADVLEREEHVSLPLRDFAEDLRRWRVTLAECGALLDAPDLARSYRNRRLVGWGLVVAAVAAVAAPSAWLGSRQLARRRIDRLLMQGGCEAERIDPRDARKASAAQRGAIDRQRAACQQQRADARRFTEERRLAEQKRLEEERQRREHLERCARLGRHFEGKALDATDDETAGRYAALLRRLAEGGVRTEDVSEDLGELPCADMPTGTTIGVALARAAIASAPVWLPNEVPSPTVARLLVDQQSALSPESRRIFGDHVEQLAGQGLHSGQTKNVVHWALVCKVKVAITPPHQGNCVAVLDLAGKP